MVNIQPAFERTVFFLQFDYFLRINNRSINPSLLRMIPASASRRSRSASVLLLCDLESMIRLTEIIRLFQDRDQESQRLISRTRRSKAHYHHQ